MATSTYTAITTQTLTSTTGTITISSIPQTYTDLLLITSVSSATGGQTSTLNFQFNGDTGTNYSYTYMQGNGSAASSGRGSNATIGVAGQEESSLLPAQFSVGRCHIMNYANTTTYKTAITRSDSPSAQTQAWVSLWRSTAAITSITLNVSGYSMAAGSKFTLYGIKAA